MLEMWVCKFWHFALIIFNFICFAFTGQTSPPAPSKASYNVDYNAKKSKTSPRKSPGPPVIVTVEVESPAPLAKEEDDFDPTKLKRTKKGQSPPVPEMAASNDLIFGNTLKTLRQRSEKNPEDDLEGSNSLETENSGNNERCSWIMEFFF